jgi:septal ring factor EnvC (AmiA/AmiB activator)
MIEGAMKNRIGIVILILACLALAAALFLVKKQATDKEHLATEKIGALSNQWVDASAQLTEQMKVNSSYQNDLANQKKAYGDLTNNYTQVSANFTQVSANFDKAQARLKAREDELQKRQAKIADLEKRIQASDNTNKNLTASIAELNSQIAETQRKLDASEGDRALLQKRLDQLNADKAELEAQFADVTIMRAQLSRDKQELSVTRRIDYIRRALFAGTQDHTSQSLLNALTGTEQPTAAATRPIDLNVEVNRSGSVRVLPPSTESPATTNSPAK